MDIDKRINLFKYSIFNIRCNTRNRIFSKHLRLFIYCHHVSNLIVTALSQTKKIPCIERAGYFGITKNVFISTILTQRYDKSSKRPN